MSSDTDWIRALVVRRPMFSEGAYMGGIVVGIQVTLVKCVP